MGLSRLSTSWVYSRAPTTWRGAQSQDTRARCEELAPRPPPTPSLCRHDRCVQLSVYSKHALVCVRTVDRPAGRRAQRRASRTCGASRRSRYVTVASAYEHNPVPAPYLVAIAPTRSSESTLNGDGLSRGYAACRSTYRRATRWLVAFHEERLLREATIIASRAALVGLGALGTLILSFE